MGPSRAADLNRLMIVYKHILAGQHVLTDTHEHAETPDMIYLQANHMSEKIDHIVYDPVFSIPKSTVRFWSGDNSAK